jgi:hypothetical protein
MAAAWAKRLGIVMIISFARLVASGQDLSGGFTNYDTQVTAVLTERAKQISAQLSKAGFIPAESFTASSVMLMGRSVRPSGNVKSAVCNYEFLFGALYGIRRADLLQDKGPDSLILYHLTNEVLTLKTNDAANRALEVLRQLSFDADAIRKAYRIEVSDDLMDGYPVRDGGPNFPKDLHFFGELISRKHIRIKVEFKPKDIGRVAESAQVGDMRVELLATTGELLAARLANPDALAALGVRGPDRITLEATPDFTPPTYIQASRKAGLPAVSVSKDEATALLDATWQDLQQKLGGRQPRCYLVCDNLNVPEVIAAEMNRLTRGTPWAGVSHFWRNDLSFDRAQMDQLAQTRRGIGVLAVCGKVQTRFASVSGLETVPASVAVKPAQGAAAGTREQFHSQREKLLEQVPLSDAMPDHTLFLFKPDKNQAAWTFFNELYMGLKGKAEVFDCMGLRSFEAGGGAKGVGYYNGHVLTNTLVVLCLSGTLPLQMDPASLMRQRPAQRLIHWEITKPIENFARSFGPHPMQELFDYLGPDGVRFLQQAERVETFRIKSNSFDDWSTAGRPAIEGHEIISRGKTQGRDFARRLAGSLLNEKDAFGGMHGCIWAPRQAFRLWQGKESATIRICFDCNEVWIKFYSEAGTPTHDICVDFGENRNAWVDLVEKAFPNDDELKPQTSDGLTPG